MACSTFAVRTVLLAGLVWAPWASWARADSSPGAVSIRAHRPYASLDARRVAERASSSSSVVLGECANIGFTVDVTIGSGGTAETFELTVDTGSQVIGIAGPACTSCDGVSPVYTPAATAVDKGQTWNMQYGSGSWVGHVYSDRVTVGGVAVPSLEFGQMTSQAQFFSSSNCELQSTAAPLLQGIMGMSYAVDGYPSFGTSIDSVFSLQLCESGGRMWLGAGDSSYYSGALQYTPIAAQNPQVYYTVDVTGMAVGTTVVGTGATAFGTSIVDSGTTYFYLPSAVYTAFTSVLAADAVFQSAFPSMLSGGAGTCYTTSYTTAELNAQLPPVQITIGTGAAAIVLALLPVDSYLQQVVIGSSVFYCLGIGASSASTPVPTIMGWTAINQYITVFDQPNNRVGFAPTTSCQNAWQTGAWSACVDCYQTRTVGACYNYLGVQVPDGACYTAMPATNQSCVSGSSCPGYAADSAGGLSPGATFGVVLVVLVVVGAAGVGVFYWYRGQRLGSGAAPPAVAVAGGAAPAVRFSASPAAVDLEGRKALPPRPAPNNSTPPPKPPKPTFTPAPAAAAPVFPPIPGRPAQAQGMPPKPATARPVPPPPPARPNKAPPPPPSWSSSSASNLR